MSSPKLTRRAALLGAAASSAALAVPAVASVRAAPDELAQIADRLPLKHRAHLLDFGRYLVTQQRSGTTPVALLEPDAELFATIAEFRAAQEEAARAWAIASPLNVAARAEMDRRGLNIDQNWGACRALFAEMGAAAAEDVAEAASQHEVDLLARVRETRPRTLAGLLAKFDVLRGELRITDDIPRCDQDIEVEFFNAFGDDLKALARRSA